MGSSFILAEKNVVFGQGKHWPDTKILKANGLNVVTSVHFEPLFPMLRNQRFNCFLRGVEEVCNDLRQINDFQFTIERTLLFSYPSASMFFVNKKDIDLAAQLELGLRRSLLDGSYKRFFQKACGNELQALKLSNRRVIRLNNPLISDTTLRKAGEPLMLNDGKLGVF